MLPRPSGSGHGDGGDAPERHLHEGVRALAEALSENPALQHLDLNDNLLTETGTAAGQRRGGGGRPGGGQVVALRTWYQQGSR